MKIYSANQITNILKRTWPGLAQIWIFDRELACLSRTEIEAIVETVWHKMQAAGEKLDCDEQALFLHAAVKKHWAALAGDNAALGFGEAAGTMFNAWPDIHNLNVAVLEDKNILIIEPQTRESWPAHATDDRPFWMRF